MAFWVHVEKGYTIFIVYFSSFKSLESLESLARLLEKVLKSCETFKIQDFANTTWDPEYFCEAGGRPGKNLKKLIVFEGAKNLTETMSIVLAQTESIFFRFRRTPI